MPGVHLGAYEVLRLIGAGGMGEVYKARDTRLDRIVAIKVLPHEFAVDDSRRERFEREARAVAALNHPHICSLHDIGESASSCEDSGPDAIRFLVMEYLEGQTLAERLLKGPLTISEVLQYSVQLADALAHAHRRGLVHRDLKPGNVMLTDEGTKLLDFGLSRIRSTSSLPALSTVSPEDVALTAEGAVLGTYPYMSPEQLAGRDVDERSDIFALGAMVYEMATGRRAFEDTTAATLIGAILHTEPPLISSVQPLAPAALDRVVVRCIAKDPEDRWQTARDLTLELRSLSKHDVAPASDAGRHIRLLAAASIAVLTIIAAIAIAIGYVRRTPTDASTVRWVFSPPDGLTLAAMVVGGPVMISPDGNRVAFVATGRDGKQLLWVRPLESLSAQALPGTDGASYPFWSADSQFVGFFAQRKLKKIDVSGGPPQTLCDAVLPRGGTWNSRGEIVFAAGAGRQMFLVPATGGAAAPLPGDGLNQERYWPLFLPDGRHYVYFGRPQKYGIFVGSIDSSPAKLLLSDYVGAAYAPPGYLVGLLGSSRGAPAGTLLAHPFDLTRLELVGQPVPVAERIQYDSGLARSAFSVSENGTLVYGTRGSSTTQLTWFDRRGNALDTVGGSVAYGQPALSPDEKTLAVERVDPNTQDEDIWLIDMGRNLPSRFTSNPNNISFLPVWSPNGDRIVFARARGAPPNLYQKVSSGGSDELLLKSNLNSQPTDWSHDGEFVVYASLDAKSQWDLWYLPMRGPQEDRHPVPFLQTEFNEHLGRLSPDGRWLAYVSDESGTNEVYVRRFPNADDKTRISLDGGNEPRWDGLGRELFYLAPDARLMAVPVTLGSHAQIGLAVALFKIRSGPIRNSGFDVNYTVTRNGQRFLASTLTEGAEATSTTIVLNWTATLGRR
jgi:eukaryotic-like serine/threonine-protein kinase